MIKDTPEQRKRFNRGFTLLEIMLTLAVISILAVVTAPKYHTLSDYYHLEGAAQTAAGRLRYAKQLAMDQRKNIGVVFTTNGVQVFQLTTPPPPDVPQLSKPLEQLQGFDAGVTYTYKNNSGVWTNGSNSYIYFDYRGFAKSNPDGTSAYFDLSKAGSNQVTVNVEAGAGKVVIQWP